MKTLTNLFKHPDMTLSIRFWKIEGAVEIPNGSLLNLYSPQNVVKEAFDWDDNYMVVEHNRHVSVDGPASVTRTV